MAIQSNQWNGFFNKVTFILTANERGYWRNVTGLTHCGMAIAVPINQRGTFTIPPEIRKCLGVDQLKNQMLLVEERDGKLSGSCRCSAGETH